MFVRAFRRRGSSSSEAKSPLGRSDSKIARLSLDFTPDEHARYAELAAKAQDGSLAADEQADMEQFLTVNAILTILQSKARVLLKKHNSAA